MFVIPTESECSTWFDRLAIVLSAYRLAADEAQTDYRQCAADEFMLMDVNREEAGGWSEARFKHTVSRNYLRVRYNLCSGTVYPIVPIGDSPWHRGAFPAPIDIGTAP